MKNKQFGFTIVEVMVVSALILILVTIAIVASQDSKKSSFNKVRKADLQSIRLAVEEYRGACDGQYPNELLLTASNGCPSGTTLGDFLFAIPTDPENGSSYNYVGLRTATGAGGEDNVCYDYHLWAELTGSGVTQLLQEDHDASAATNVCKTGTSDEAGDDDDKLYDFRSRNAG